MDNRLGLAVVRLLLLLHTAVASTFSPHQCRRRDPSAHLLLRVDIDGRDGRSTRRAGRPRVLTN